MKFIETAYQGKNSFWLYAIGVIMIIALSILGSFPFVIVLEAIDGNIQGAETMDFEKMGMNPNLGLFLNLVPFITGLAALFLAVARIHDRPLRTVITARSKIDWSRFFFAFVLWFGLTTVAEVIMYVIEPHNYQWQFQAGPFLGLALVSLLFIPLQSSFEEIMLRGYLMQGIGLRFKYRLVPLLLTSAIFGALHLANPEIEKFGTGIMMVYYIGFGLVAGIFTLIDDGLEVAMGLHAANNIYGSLIVTFEGSALQTSALFRLQSLDPYLMLYGWFGMIAVYTLILSKKYSWTKEMAKGLFGKISENVGKF